MRGPCRPSGLQAAACRARPTALIIPSKKVSVSPGYDSVRAAMEEVMATHSSSLAWRSPWTGEPGGLQSEGPQRVGHD